MRSHHTHDLCFRVLVYKEGGDFVAHALEADLMGYGSTVEAAMRELVEALEAQITFAIQMNDLSLIQKSAPQECFDQWEEVHNERMRSKFRAISKGSQPKLAASSRSDARYYGFSSDEIQSLGSNRLEPYLAKA